VNIEHLKSMLFQKNKKGRYREITIIPKIEKKPYKSGGTRNRYPRVVSRCVHCNVPVAVTRGISVARATCFNCIERQRVARLSA